MPKTIKMTQDFPVAPNGFDTTVWHEGEVHEDVIDQLAGELIKAGYAEAVKAPKDPEDGTPKAPAKAGA